jgi:3-methylcrotonyl-CoA carboxylase alpha subunit
MIESLLIANRGEIACRVIRTARRLGIRTIAVHSQADAGAMFTQMADEAHLIGPAPARESYLVAERILEVARRTGAQAIHPGYGFLSENAEFAEACAAAGIIFVGPPASAIRAMGLKDAAKALAEKAGVPVVPGYHGKDQDAALLAREAARIGYPVLIKAVAGGGGKGMRRVDSPADFADALASAQREGQSAFGDPRVLVEKYVLSPRHIEIQVFGDSHGHVVHLFERDCSLQRRHQKVIEEAPAPGMPLAMREAMGKAAVEAAKAVGYVGAGTVEFIADGREGLHPDRFYFMEMNTRLQVEHPVTEAITGLDLVELQLRVASGEKLGFAQKDLAICGHAVEARLYAEDVEGGFLPSTGKLFGLTLPEGEGIRVDTGVRQGDSVTPHYDPMIAKIIAQGVDRNEALDRLSAALSRTLVAGPKANVAFLKALCDAEGFRKGPFDTGFIERNLDALGAVQREPDMALVAAAGTRLVTDQQAGPDRQSPWRSADGFALLPMPPAPVRLIVEGQPVEALVTSAGGQVAVAIAGIAARASADAVFVANDDGLIIVEHGRQTRVALDDPLAVDLDALDGGGGGAIRSPMHGKVIAVLVSAGDHVEKGQRLAIVEAMKMEHVLTAPRAGVIAEVLAQAGQQVAEKARLIVIGEAA